MMDDVGSPGQDWLPQRFTRLLDHLGPAEKVRAVDAVMERYCEAADWITARAKVFTKLAMVRGIL